MNLWVMIKNTEPATLGMLIIFFGLSILFIIYSVMCVLGWGGCEI